MRTMPSTPSTSTLLRSTLLRGAAIAVALTLPGQALAGWGDENWGTMLWGQSASVPVPGLEWFGLGVLALGLLATTAWTLRKRRPGLGLPVLLVLLAIPLVVAADTLNVPNTFTNGTTADANQGNANFAAAETAVNDNDSRITADHSSATIREMALGYPIPRDLEHSLPCCRPVKRVSASWQGGKASTAFAAPWQRRLPWTRGQKGLAIANQAASAPSAAAINQAGPPGSTRLLYTSDAAHEPTRVRHGRDRALYKKNSTHNNIIIIDII